ncbi:DegV family protein [Mycoplasma sp. P36-A1]|uniref:DegV family protein n=1 Tax=Mycoplasma sp. P36-A1 TaxID=3252900 RepID=UPI003C2C3FFC
MKIAYLLDSSSSLKKDNELKSMSNVYYLPLSIMIDGQEHHDLDCQNGNNELDEKIKTAKNISTSQPTFQTIQNVLEKIKEDGYDVLVSSLLGSGLSNTQNLVYSIALEMKLTIVQLDCKGIGPMSRAAIRKFRSETAKGLSLVQAQTNVQHMLDVSNCYGVIADVATLRKSGRISRTNALIKSLMDVKQVVMCDKNCCGRIKGIASIRTNSKAIDRMVEEAFKNIVSKEYTFWIGHYKAEDLIEATVAAIKKRDINAKIEILELTDTVGVHTGPHCISLMTVRN